MADSNAQLDKAEKLQDLLLDSFLELFQNRGETAADRATLLKMLKENGWSLDPSRLPQSLKDKLTLSDPSVLDEDDDIVGTIAKVG
jgi:hypothetical protein